MRSRAWRQIWSGCIEVSRRDEEVLEKLVYGIWSVHDLLVLQDRKGADDIQSKLVEVGFSGLMQLFLKLAREGTGKTCDPDSMIRQGKLANTETLLVIDKKELRHLQTTSLRFRP
jgi:hypothetical protein